ncbi:MAG: DUF6789 family protein [Candidatus Wenzhouxiangella sp. M2_3B_020]
MNGNVKGLIAGAIATAVLSALMLIKGAMGMLPQFNVIAMLAGTLGGGPIVGWIAHIAIGVVLYGLVIANLSHALPGGSPAVKGIVLGVIGWLVMMLVAMPVMGGGFFAGNLGIPVVVATLVLHLIFGAVLGFSFGKLDGDTARAPQAGA